MMLNEKVAVVYGAGGAIGGAVARAFADEGARVFPTRVDALDERAVDEHADAVASEAGSLDISMNVIAQPAKHGTPMTEMAFADFFESIEVAVKTSFLTVRAGARHMMRQKSGVFLWFGGSGDPMRDYYIGGTQIAFEAVEAMRRQLGTELGSHGIRTVTLRTGGVPESLPSGFEGSEAIVDGMVSSTLLGRAATLEDVGNTAAFAASDRARTMTAATLNVSAGALID
jgi:3-oxoacyl-[acyl-carrier protein] reductase